MKYWGYLLAKLIVAAGPIWLIGRAIRYIWGEQRDPFAHDLAYTTAMMLYFLFCVGVLYLIIWDQRYRCRTCLRRLRMPLFAGSWPNMLLKGQPRMEYICIYGHGTLKVPEVELSGPKNSDWEAHGDDIWKELESYEITQR
jgi:hypothetical protein